MCKPCRPSILNVNRKSGMFPSKRLVSMLMTVWRSTTVNLLWYPYVIMPESLNFCVCMVMVVHVLLCLYWLNSQSANTRLVVCGYTLIIFWQFCTVQVLIYTFYLIFWRTNMIIFYWCRHSIYNLLNCKYNIIIRLKSNIFLLTNTIMP